MTARYVPSYAVPARTEVPGALRTPAPVPASVSAGIRTGGAQCQPRDADILPAVAGVDGGTPLTGQRGQHGQRAGACRSDRQVDVLERPLQREFGCEVTASHLVQLRVGDGGVERAALDGLRQLYFIDAQLAGELEGFGYALDQGGHIRVDDEFHATAPACFA